jgi:hypothetical protein
MNPYGFRRLREQIDAEMTACQRCVELRELIVSAAKPTTPFAVERLLWNHFNEHRRTFRPRPDLTLH